MNIIRIILTLSVLFFFISCAAIEKKCDVESAKKNIKIGQSTRENVLQMCGEPISKKSLNEVDIWHYSYREKNAMSLDAIADAVGMGPGKKRTRQRMDIYFKGGVAIELRTDSGEDGKIQ